MIGTLKRLSRLPVVPVFGRHPHQFTVHAETWPAVLPSWWRIDLSARHLAWLIRNRSRSAASSTGSLPDGIRDS